MDGDFMKDPEDSDFLNYYLNQRLKVGVDVSIFMKVLGEAVQERYGGITEFAKLTGLSRSALYRTLVDQEIPSLKVLDALLETMGYELKVVKKEKKKMKKPSKKSRPGSKKNV
jgi:probable addiction module antidote protein